MIVWIIYSLSMDIFLEHFAIRNWNSLWIFMHLLAGATADKIDWFIFYGFLISGSDPLRPLLKHIIKTTSILLHNWKLHCNQCSNRCGKIWWRVMLQGFTKSWCKPRCQIIEGCGRSKWNSTFLRDNLFVFLFQIKTYHVLMSI